MSDLNCTPEIIPITNKRIKDITGQKFGRLTVLGYVGSVPLKRITLWLCQCDCGNKHTADGHYMRTGNTRSCGCLKTEAVAGTGRANKVHGMNETPEYQAWSNMRQRCYNPKYDHYADYGGRGITICDRWRDSFENFYADLGARPSPDHSLDRIDNNTGYSPDNCRWATRERQGNNRRSNRLVSFHDKIYTLSQLSRLLNLKVGSLLACLNRGLSAEEALLTLTKSKK